MTGTWHWCQRAGLLIVGVVAGTIAAATWVASYTCVTDMELMLIDWLIAMEVRVASIAGVRLLF